MNKEGVHIHGGATGFHRQLWTGVAGADAGVARAVFSLASPDGHEGYPGKVEVSVTYTLTNDNVLRLDYAGKTDRPTHLNLTNHVYFNLAGSGDIREHVLAMDCAEVLAIDPRKVPTGGFLGVAGTPFDFRIAKPVGKDIESVEGGGYDHCFVIPRTGEGKARPVPFATLTDRSSGRTLKIATTKPGVQIFTANSFKGEPFPKWGGICFETQFYPDTPNRPEFPTKSAASGEPTGIPRSFSSESRIEGDCTSTRFAHLRRCPSCPSFSPPSFSAPSFSSRCSRSSHATSCPGTWQPGGLDDVSSLFPGRTPRRLRLRPRARHLSPRARGLQAGIHFALLLLAFLVLPITPDAEWKPDGTEASPAGGIVRLLAYTVGIPYLLLSASGPLLQHWFAESHPGRSPYRLYAISNLGSLLGLLTYPFLFEPRLDVNQQRCSGRRPSRDTPSSPSPRESSSSAAPARWRIRDSSVAEGPRPPLVDVVLWIAFSACGSMLLLSLTSQMCQDVAVVPFLWVVPLSLYLLTFVIAFDHERWYLRTVAIPLAAARSAHDLADELQYASSEWPLFRQIAVYCGAIFFGCLVCHGEIVRMKPAVRHLTGFYLCISSAVRSVADLSVSPPRAFQRLLGIAPLLRPPRPPRQLPALAPLPPFEAPRPRPRRAALWIALLVVMVHFLGKHMEETRDQSIVMRAAFTECSGRGNQRRHRVRLPLAPSRPHQPRPPVRRRIRSRAGHDLLQPQQRRRRGLRMPPARTATPAQPVHIGVVGLGVGTITAYAEPGDHSASTRSILR